MIRLKIHRQVSVRLPRKKLNELFAEIMKLETDKRAGGTVNLILTSDAEIRKLNKSFRNKDKATDVLSFNIEKPVNEKLVMGEVYISVETAKRQALDYDASLVQEITRLFCHGLLHLLGYDHVTKKERVKMEERERHFLSLC